VSDLRSWQTLGAVQAPFDPNDHPLDRHMALAAELPARFVLSRAKVPAPLNQGNKPYCVGASGALNRTITEAPEAGGLVHFDFERLYFETKARDGSPNTPGTYVRVACKVLLDLGALVVGTAADRRKIASYSSLMSGDRIGQIKQAIFGGGDPTLEGAAWLAMPWPPGWMHVLADGFLRGSNHGVDAGHAIAAIGWDDAAPCPDGTRGALLLRQSWGLWGITVDGIAGCCWMPYSMVPNLWEAWKTLDAPNPRPYEPRNAEMFTAIAPRHVFDTRTGAPMVTGESRVVSLGLPAGTVAVTGQITCVAARGWGDLYAGPDESAGALVQVPMKGRELPNGFTVGLAADGSLTLRLTGPVGNSTHVYIDVTGYFTA
jgi:hypothetical protein